MVASTVRVINSDSKFVVRWLLSSTSRSLARSANRLISPGAAYSAKSPEVPSRSIRRPTPAGRAPPHPPPDAGGPPLEQGAVLESEQLDRPTGEPQAAGGEGQARRGTGEQLVAELLAELADGQRDGGRGHAELAGGRLDRPEPDDGGERAQLGRRHR